MAPGIIDTIIFDFGGTLDTNGIHWSRKFFEAYLRHNYEISHTDFIDAYIFAERNVGALINREDSFFTTLNAKISLQLKYMTDQGIIKAEHSADQKEILLECYNDVLNSAGVSRKILNNLSRNFKLGIASNFYGNLMNVLEELSLNQYFLYVFDSGAEGMRKPDTEVFNIAIKKMNSTCAHTLVVGDSYNKDIEPAKSIGCTTVWLLNKPFVKPVEQNTADYVISSLTELDVLEILKK